MVNSCVAANRTNKSSLSLGISLHTIPFFNDDRPEAKRRRKIWVDFVKAKRVFQPSKASTLCSAHFLPEDYERRFQMLPGQTRPNFPKLRSDDFGICVFPSIHASSKETSSEPPVQSPRDRRMLIKAVQKGHTCHSETEPSSMDIGTTAQTPRSTNTGTQRKKRRRETKEAEMPEENHPDKPVNVESSVELEKILEDNRQLKNKIISLQTFAQRNKSKMKQMKREVKQLEQQSAQHSMPTQDEKKTEEKESDEVDDDSITEEDDEEFIEEASDLLQVDGNLRTEPKFIVFLSQLLLLFQFCHSCKADNPLVETKAVGSNGIVTTKCNNPKCTQKIRTWHTQPLMPGRKKARAGNFLMCMSTLLGGGSFPKVRQICLHMGLGCVSHSTYFRYQRTVLFPSIYLHWKKYQAVLLEKAKQPKDGVVLAGEGRYDSMGHSAKFCAYTIFCCTFALIIHFDLVQIKRYLYRSS